MCSVLIIRSKVSAFIHTIEKLNHSMHPEECKQF